MELLLPGGIAAASLSLTYLMCIRPMRKAGHCSTMPAAKTSRRTSDDDAEITRLRNEVASLRQELADDPVLQHPAGG